MKSFTILAFGLVVLVAVSMAYPQVAEEDDDVEDQVALEEEGEAELDEPAEAKSPCPRRCKRRAFCCKKIKKCVWKKQRKAKCPK